MLSCLHSFQPAPPAAISSPASSHSAASATWPPQADATCVACVCGALPLGARAAPPNKPGLAHRIWPAATWRAAGMALSAILAMADAQVETGDRAGERDRARSRSRSRSAHSESSSEAPGPSRPGAPPPAERGPPAEAERTNNWRPAPDAAVSARLMSLVIMSLLALGLAPYAARHDDRRIEAIANGLPLWGGTQLAVDTTLVSPRTSARAPRRSSDTNAGAALAEARRSKERTYSEFGRAARCRLVVLGIEVCGRWSANFVRLLARARARHATPLQRVAAFVGRWSRLLTVAATRSFGTSLLSLGQSPIPSHLCSATSSLPLVSRLA
eukprot:s4384_g2.t1